MKKLVIIIFIIGVVAVAAWYFTLPQKANISDTLSERSKKYIADQKKKENEQWQSVDFSEQKVAAVGKVVKSTRVKVGNCFSLEIPFSIWLTKKREQCFYQWGVESPRATIRAYMREDSHTSIDDVQDVKMRRIFPETYEEEKRVVKGNTYLFFREKGDTYEKIVFFLTQGKIFVLSITTPGAQNMDKKITSMITSLSFEPNITLVPTATLTQSPTLESTASATVEEE